MLCYSMKHHCLFCYCTAAAAAAAAAAVNCLCLAAAAAAAAGIRMLCCRACLVCQWSGLMPGGRGTKKRWLNQSPTAAAAAAAAAIDAL
jgi:hypothetical protein